jgi:hypothetical protein
MRMRPRYTNSQWAVANGKRSPLAKHPMKKKLKSKPLRNRTEQPLSLHCVPAGIAGGRRCFLVGSAVIVDVRSVIVRIQLIKFFDAVEDDAENMFSSEKRNGSFKTFARRPSCPRY